MSFTSESPQRSEYGGTAMLYCLLAALAMGYGWGYRGTVGHEYGAMVPGALLGLMLCVASGRLDWHRRSAVVGLFAAVGWAWGGSLSYMEQTFYVLSDSFPDVLYGYAMIFFLGALWAGCGGAVLGLGLTESRSNLECLIRPFAAVSSVFLLAFIYLRIDPQLSDTYYTFTAIHLHDGKWLAATLTLVASAVYWIVAPRDRQGTSLFFWGAVAWWLGYGLLTKIGGLRLAPLHRSESWGGVLGVLIVLIISLIRRKNWAALTLSLYGCLGGGLAFVLAVFVHNAMELRWGPIANTNLNIPAWRTAEVTFGFLMGLCLALGTLRLLRGGLAPADEDCDPAPSDTFSVFVLIVALSWVNFRRHLARLLQLSPNADPFPFLGISTGGWYFLLGVFLTIPFLVLLWRYRCGDRSWAPRSAFGKGAALVLLLLWGTCAAQMFDGYPTRQGLLGHLIVWIPAIAATCLLVSFVAPAERADVPTGARTSASDPGWHVGWPYLTGVAVMPWVIVLVAALSVHLQEKSAGERGRLRFGPDAYWRKTERLKGTWKVLGMTDEVGGTEVVETELPLRQIDFGINRRVTSVLPDGEEVKKHQWFLKNQYIWLRWYGRERGHKEAAEVPLQFEDDLLYVKWPPAAENGKFLVLERQVNEE